MNPWPILHHGRRFFNGVATGHTLRYLQQFYQRIQRRRGGGKANIAFWPANTWESSITPSKQLGVHRLPQRRPGLLKTGPNYSMSRQLFMGGTMTSIYPESALLLISGLGIWEGIGFAILILLCPAAMYFGMRGKGKEPDRDTKREETDINR